MSIVDRVISRAHAGWGLRPAFGSRGRRIKRITTLLSGAAKAIYNPPRAVSPPWSQRPGYYGDCATRALAMAPEQA